MKYKFGGFSLIEVILATGIFSTTTLAVLHLQWSSYRQVQDAFEMTLARQVLENWISELRSQHRDPVEYSGKLHEVVQKTLPNGRASIQKDGSIFCAKVVWNPRHAKKAYQFELPFLP